MSFCTAINCMDGRVQLPVIRFMQERFQSQYVDIISEPGPNRILSEQKDQQRIDSILKRIDISIHHHQSKGLAVVGHYDCAGNPVNKAEQMLHLQGAMRLLKEYYSDMEIISLWVNEHWQVEEIPLTGRVNDAKQDLSEKKSQWGYVIKPDDSWGYK